MNASAAAPDLPADKSRAARLQWPVPVRLPTRRDVPIGCIGAGFIMADCQLVAYRQAGLNPRAILSRDRQRATDVATRHSIPIVETELDRFLAHSELEVIDIAVPPDVQAGVIRRILQDAPHVKGILAQKPLGVNYAEAAEIVTACRAAGVTLAVNQNMRFDQSVRGLKQLLETGTLGEPVLATIDMRAIPHWMPWQQHQGWVTLRIMSIHHIDTFRYWFGTPRRIYASVRPDPRTARQFAHTDGIAMYILEYDSGLRAMSCDDVWAGPAKEGAAAEIGIGWRVEGIDGLAKGTIGWPRYPERTPSTLDYSTVADAGQWHQPRWPDVWFPDAFIGPMADLLVALETHSTPAISGEDNLWTMAAVEACYRSAAEHRAVELTEIHPN